MRIKESFILRKIAGTKVIIPVENSIADFDGIIVVNDTAAFLFEKLQEEVSVESLVNMLVEEYEVSLEDAKNDVNWFIEVLTERNMLLQNCSEQGVEGRRE